MWSVKAGGKRISFRIISIFLFLGERLKFEKFISYSVRILEYNFKIGHLEKLKGM